MDIAPCIVALVQLEAMAQLQSCPSNLRCLYTSLVDWAATSAVNQRSDYQGCFDAGRRLGQHRVLDHTLGVAEDQGQNAVPVFHIVECGVRCVTVFPRCYFISSVACCARNLDPVYRVFTLLCAVLETSGNGFCAWGVAGGCKICGALAE